MRAIIAARLADHAWLWLALGVSVLFRAALLWAEAVPFNSDEAIVALMARHILHSARPIFFYGQAYMGSLDAWLVAGAFRLFGESVWAVRLVQIALYCGYIASVWVLARCWFASHRIAALAAWLCALPPVLVTTYTTASLGGYGESVLLGNLILWLGWSVVEGGKGESRAHWFALGLIGGLAFWTLGIAGIYLLPVGMLGLRRFRWQWWPNYTLAALAFLLGSAPWWWHNLIHDWAAWQALFGASASNGVAVSERAFGFALLGLPAVLGLRAPWSTDFLPPALLIPIVATYAMVAAYHLWGARRGQPAMANGGRLLLWLVPLTLAATMLGTSFGTDSTGRYFLPLYVIVALALASALDAVWAVRPWLGALGLTAMLAVNVFGNVQAAQSEDKLTTQFDPATRWGNAHDAELIEFLTAHDLTRGYSNYWVTFRLAFLSGERIQYAPALPYKSSLDYFASDDRYPPYTQAADSADRVAYIATTHTQLAQVLRTAFAQREVSFIEKQIGPYVVFYELSRVVRPQELTLTR